MWDNFPERLSAILKVPDDWSITLMFYERSLKFSEGMLEFRINGIL